MKKITKTQLITIIAFILYAIWEFYVAKWAETQIGAIIRVDLLIIYPILILLIALTIRQLFGSKK